MPGPLVVAYTGRPELKSCRVMVEAQGCEVVEFGGPADLGVSAAGSHIFTPEEIARARFGIVNLHLAPLPEYRGRFSAAHALKNGDQEYGVTLHYVDEGIDTGPIIDATRFSIPPDETVERLRARALLDGEYLFSLVFPRLVEAATRGERLPAEPQDESRACYYDRFSLPGAAKC